MNAVKKSMVPLLRGGRNLTKKEGISSDLVLSLGFLFKKKKCAEKFLSDEVLSYDRSNCNNGLKIWNHLQKTLSG